MTRRRGGGGRQGCRTAVAVVGSVSTARATEPTLAERLGEILPTADPNATGELAGTEERRLELVNAVAYVVWAMFDPRFLAHGCSTFASLFRAAAFDMEDALFDVVAGGWRGNGAFYRGRPSDLRKHGRFHAFNARKHPNGRIEVADVTATTWAEPALVWGWAEDVERDNPGRTWAPRADTTRILAARAAPDEDWLGVSRQYITAYLRKGPKGLPDPAELRSRITKRALSPDALAKRKGVLR